MSEIIASAIVLFFAGAYLMMIDFGWVRTGPYDRPLAIIYIGVGLGQVLRGLRQIIDGDMVAGGLIGATGICNLVIAVAFWRKGGPPRRRRRRVRQAIRRLASGRLIPVGAR